MDDSHIKNMSLWQEITFKFKGISIPTTIFIKFLRPSGNKAKHTKQGFQNPLHH